MKELDFARIGKNIRSRRNELGLTQEYVGNFLDVNTSHISNIECGRTHASLTALVCIANALRCSVDRFIYEEYTYSPESRDEKYEIEVVKRINSCDRENREKILKILDILQS